MASLYLLAIYSVYWWQMSPYVEPWDHPGHTECGHLVYLLGHHFHKSSILHQQVLACLLHGAKERNQREQVDSCTTHP